MNDLIRTVVNFTNSIKPVTPILAGLVLVIIGLFWMLAKDAQKKEQYVGWMINVFIGFGIVYLAASLISWAGTNVVGF